MRYPGHSEVLPRRLSDPTRTQPQLIKIAVFVFFIVEFESVPDQDQFWNKIVRIIKHTK